VGDKEHGLQRTFPPKADDEIHMLRRRPGEGHLPVRKAGCAKAGRQRLGGLCATYIERRVYADEFRENVARKSLMRGESGRFRGRLTYDNLSEAGRSGEEKKADIAEAGSHAQ
jgi:hypothetical protein